METEQATKPKWVKEEQLKKRAETPRDKAPRKHRFQKRMGCRMSYKGRFSSHRPPSRNKKNLAKQSNSPPKEPRNGRINRPQISKRKEATKIRERETERLKGQPKRSAKQELLSEKAKRP